MKLIKYLILTLLCLSNLAFGGVTDWKSESDIPLNQCNLQTVVSFHMYNNSRIQALYAKETIKLVDEVTALANKAKNPNLSVGEQLSVEDRIAFDVNKERRITISLQRLIESNKLRDVEFLEKLTKVAYQNYRFDEIYDKKDSNYAYQNYVYLLRAMDEKYPNKSDSFSKTPTDKCSFNLAIEPFQNEAIAKLNTINVDALLSKLKALAQKNRMESIEYAKLSKADKDYYDKLNTNELLPLKKAKQLADDIEDLKSLSNASDIIYKSLKDDLNYSGGNSKNYGQSLKNIQVSKETSERMKYLLSMWEIIATNYPSEHQKQTKEMADYATKVGDESIEKIKKYKESKK